MKTTTEEKKNGTFPKLPPTLKGYWEDAYHLLRDRAHTSEAEARDFADGKVRIIRRLERQLAGT
jgi:hypothetical protein